VRSDGTVAFGPIAASSSNDNRPVSTAPAANVRARVGAAASDAAPLVHIPFDVIMSVSPEAIDIKSRLQEFARNNRDLYGTTKWLAGLNFQSYYNIYQSPWAETGHKLRKNLELTLPILQNPSANDDDDPDTQAKGSSKPTEPQDAVNDARTKLAAYQDIRAASNAAQQTSAFFWGAVTTYALPVLYAVLGMMAFTLRDLCQRSVTKTYLPASTRHITRARLVVAIIMGTVIGLFSHLFTGTGISASLLCFAFVMGFATDRFFQNIDSMAGATGSNA
jgi:hypothetical protein